MRKYFWLFVLVFAALAGCQEKKTSIILPDVKSSFSSQLIRKDSALVVDSFYLVGIDTITKKSSLLHQRFPYFHILERVNKQLDSVKKLIDSSATKPSYYDLDQMKTLQEEKIYVSKEIDSLSNLFVSADSVKPEGYRAIYKVTLHKLNQFSISDTIAYSLSLKMELADWDRNIEKAIDSLAVGNHVLRGPFHIKTVVK